MAGEGNRHCGGQGATASGRTCNQPSCSKGAIGCPKDTQIFGIALALISSIESGQS